MKSTRLASSLPFELQLLLLILRTEDTPDLNKELHDLAVKGIDWEQFVQLANRHRVYPTIMTKLHELEEELKLGFMESLQLMSRRNTFQMLLLTAEMEKVCKAFREQNIDTLVLKGPVLAEALYGDLSSRTSKDIDMLVSAEHVEQAEIAIRQLGYVPDEEIPRILNDMIQKWHHLGFTHPRTGVQIELHWRMSPETFREPAFSELWERRQTMKQTTEPVYYLGQEDLFVYLTLHGARHGWFRLRWLVDIDRMIRMNNMDWKIVIERFRESDSLHVCGQTMILLSQLFNSPIPSALQTFADNDRSQRLAEEAVRIIRELVYIKEKQTQKEALNYFKVYDKLLSTRQQRLRLLLNRLYPSSLDAQMLPLPKQLHFLYFPLRPFLWAWRKKNSKHQHKIVTKNHAATKQEPKKVNVL
ncbi:nucleotidyltransferase domain-containing protein [Paenibacillus kobensis]|uniref:nucleotidyltransferase domain-containing protein n=1 Tax=Paenibacillus kobensis TaxID=59841 RepID=UPI000FDBD6ED|nr:nucleotidyltransferase family protein [Paenibacillus kobensis]